MRSGRHKNVSWCVDDPVFLCWKNRFAFVLLDCQLNIWPLFYRKKKPKLRRRGRRKLLHQSLRSGKENFPQMLKVLQRMKCRMDIRICFLLLWNTSRQVSILYLLHSFEGSVLYLQLAHEHLNWVHMKTMDEIQLLSWDCSLSKLSKIVETRSTWS